MKNKYCSPLLSMTFIFALLALATPATEALAQAYQGHLRFLESFAIRLYDRGETGQAMKEFERLQRIEPNNPVAADYLKKINAGVKPEVLSKTSAERMNGIAQDLEDLKKYIAAYERDTKARDPDPGPHHRERRALRHAGKAHAGAHGTAHPAFRHFLRGQLPRA
jgi:tetratricopeptide (TPR) repeat protein